MYNQPVKKSGFTLIELMITVAIAALVALIGIPSFTSSIRSNRLTTNTNDFVTALSFARSEAIKRGEQIVVRKTGSEWENGWQVFVDIDRDSPASDANTFNDDGDGTLCEAAEDCLLRVYAALPGSFTLRGNNNFTNYVRFTPAGLSNTMGSFVVCDNSDGNNAPEASTSKLIVVNAVGRTRIGVDANSNGIPEMDDGTEIDSCVSPFTP